MLTKKCYNSKTSKIFYFIFTLDDMKSSTNSSQSEINALKSDKEELEIEIQKLKDKLHQFKKKSVDSEMDIQKTNESITEMEDRTKALEDKLRESEIIRDGLILCRETKSKRFLHAMEIKKLFLDVFC